MPNKQMVTEEEYNLMKQLQTRWGVDTRAISALYEIFHENTNVTLKLNCPTCVKTVVNWGNSQITEYELNR